MNSHAALDLIETIGVGNRVKEGRLRQAVNVVADRLASSIGRDFLLLDNYGVCLLADENGNKRPRLTHKRSTRVVVFGEGITEGPHWPVSVDLTRLSGAIQNGLLTKIAKMLETERNELRKHSGTVDAHGLSVIEGGKS